MISVAKKEDCCGCGACSAVCPVRCIVMMMDDEGFAYPEVDSSRCISCGLCESVCPFASSIESAPVLSVYAAKTEDASLRMHSSSGGVFTELCRMTLSRGGLVYGVVMCDNNRCCRFTKATTEEELAPMRGSKYMQSDTDDVYGEVVKMLRRGREVLFCGTPCQANALAAYIDSRHLSRDLLTLVDFVCHGVPSPSLWAASVDEYERRNNARVRSVRFRSKIHGWRRFSLEIQSDKLTSSEPIGESSYLRLFLRNVCLRPSCYACRAKGRRESDITIADFWGIETVAPYFDDDTGCSLVIIRNDKGEQELKRASLKRLRVSYGDAVAQNPSEYRSVQRPVAREKFYTDLAERGYEWVVKKYASESRRKAIGRKIRGLANKLLKIE